MRTAAVGCCFAGLLSLATGLVASVAGAQGPPNPYAEFRADALVGNGTAAQAGIGAVIPMGTYVRFSIDGAAGSTWRDGISRASGRVDAIGRFMLDPFREMPVGLSLGGGVSVPFVQGSARVRPYLTTVIDVEGRRHGPVTPALQIGLGGGARLGVLFRMSPGRWR